MRTILLIACLGCAAVAGATPPARDHDAARAAVARGERVPLARIVADALARHPGKVVDVELEDGEYEIEVLRDDGVVVELEYDARSGRLLDTELED
jgi:uncharacterized membrane protein YkoI